MPSVHITNSLISLFQATAVNKHKSLAARAHLELNSGIGSCQLTNCCGSIAVIWMNYRPQYPFVWGLWARGVEQTGVNGWNLIQACASFSKAMYPSSVWLFCVVNSISMQTAIILCWKVSLVWKTKYKLIIQLAETYFALFCQRLKYLGQSFLPLCLCTISTLGLAASLQMPRSKHPLPSTLLVESSAPCWWCQADLIVHAQREKWHPRLGECSLWQADKSPSCQLTSKASVRGSSLCLLAFCPQAFRRWNSDWLQHIQTATERNVWSVLCVSISKGDPHN